MADTNVQRLPAEALYQRELEALMAAERDSVPAGWRMSPRSVLTYITGGETVKGVEITPKYVGNRRLVEIAIATLVTDRALLLIGEPGTAKSWLSEHLSAAVNGDSTKVVQGTAGTTEDMIKYSWNYALLLAKGPSREALVPSPLYVGMEKGILTRFEEITRTPAEVQDSLISVLSDKVLNIPELGDEGLLFARPGFNVIGTANTRDKGVNEMSSALKRRFNFETVQPVGDVALEKQIILNEVGALADAAGIGQPLDDEAAGLLAATYHELREGVSDTGQRIEKPGAVMSTAEAISVYFQTLMTAWYYGDGRMDDRVLVDNLVGAVAKESREDLDKISSYFSTVVRDKARQEGGPWKRYYEARSRLK